MHKGDKQFPCTYHGCKRFGKYLPKYNVPAEGHDLDSHQPLGIIVTMQLCEEHYNGFSVDQLPDLKRLVEMQCESHGLATPDFARAWVSKVYVDSVEHRRFLQTMAAQVMAKNNKGDLLQ